MRIVENGLLLLRYGDWLEWSDEFMDRWASLFLFSSMLC